MNRNERIKEQARQIREVLESHRRWYTADIGTFKKDVDMSVLGPREIDRIKDAVHRIICEASGVKP